MKDAIRKKWTPKDRGFTIFELLITFTVISILAAVALPRINLHQFRVDAGVRQSQHFSRALASRCNGNTMSM